MKRPTCCNTKMYQSIYRSKSWFDRHKPAEIRYHCRHCRKVILVPSEKK